MIAMPKPRISVVVNTRNEESRLAYALRSVKPWAAEIVVADMASEDGTRSVASRFGARIVDVEPMGFVEPARALACERATGEWILVLDADEVVPRPLSERLCAIAERNEADVVRIPFLNYVLGDRLLHTGWNPERDRHVRFFKRGLVEMPEEIHGELRPRAGARSLELGFDEAIVHFNCIDTAHFIEKLDRYTSIEAEQAFARHQRSTPPRALFDAAREWAVRYLWHGGYRDGWRGIYLALLMAMYRIVKHSKLEERRRFGPRTEIEKRYHLEAERLLSDYERDDPRAGSPR
jgi:glycosyltransferase involved in cell wall biosynthesis